MSTLKTNKIQDQSGSGDVELNANLGVKTNSPGTEFEIAGRGRATATGTTPSAGTGIEWGYNTSSNYGFLLAYDRAGSANKELRFGNGALTIAAGGAVTATGTLSAGVATLATGSTIGNLTFANGSITDSSGSISMGDENLALTGQLLLGNSTAQTIVSVVPKVQVEGLGYANSSISIFNNSNDDVGSHLYIGKSRGTSLSSNTIVQDGDAIGGIHFVAADGTDRASRAAGIFAVVDGTPGANDTPAELLFQTTADGANSPTTQMAIKSNGNVGIGTAAPIPNVNASARAFVVSGNGVNIPEIKVGGSGVAELSIAGGSSATYLYTKGAYPLQIYINEIERMRIDSTGNVGIGTAVPDRTLTVDGSVGVKTASATGSPQIAFRQNTTDKAYLTYWDASDTLALTNSAAAGLHFDPTNVRVGIGETAPGALLHLKKNNGSAAIRMEREDTSVSSGSEIGGLIMTGGESSADVPVARIVTYADDAWTSSSSPTRIEFEVTPPGSTADVLAMTLDSLGLLGIGTAAPRVPLHVSGNSPSVALISAQFDGRTDDTPLCIYNDANSSAILSELTWGADTVAVELYHPASGTPAVKCYAGGALRSTLDATGLGLGTAAPAQLLHLSGAATAPQLLIEDTGNNTATLTLDGDRASENQETGKIFFNWNNNNIAKITGLAGPSTTPKNDGKLSFQTAATGGTMTERMRIDNAGNINITGLSASSDVQTDGSKNLVTTSDERLKNADGFIENALSTIEQLTPRYFFWKHDVENGVEARQLGFFSQEVHALIPEAAPVEDDIWGLNTRALVAYLTAAVQELSAKINKLEN